MTRQQIDQLIMVVVAALCAAGTTVGYLVAESREAALRADYLTASAQGVFESVSTQVLRTGESLRTAATMLDAMGASNSTPLTASVSPIPHLITEPGGVRWHAREDRAPPARQRIVGEIQATGDTASGNSFELLTTPDPARGGARATGSLSTRISVASMLSEAAYRSEAQQLEIEVFDQSEGASRSIFRSVPFNHVPDPQATIRSTLDVFGHPWEIVLRPMAITRPWGNTPDLVLAGGITLTVLLLLLLSTVTRARNRIAAAETREQEERAKRQQDELNRQLSERIAQLDRSHGIGEMAFVIGHEISQPLTAINSYAQLGETMAEGSEEPMPQMRAIFSKIGRNAARARGLLDQIRSYVRGTPTQNVVVDLNKVVNEVVELLEAEAQRLQVTLSLNLRPTEAPVMGDPLQMSQVVVNVLRNAMEASAGAPLSEVEIQLDSDGQLLHLQVRDHGQGFSEAALRQAGTPFFTTKTTGMGLGLAICANIIQAHGGSLGFSNAPDGGAQVQIRLPIGC